MKPCEGCGKYISDFDRVCPYCGHESETPETESEETQSAPVNLKKEAAEPVPVSLEKKREEERPESSIPDENDAPFGNNTAFNSSRTTDPYRGHPMKWHKFMMVMMIIGAVITIFSGFSLAVVGGSYTEDVYAAFPGLETVTRIYGFAAIALGVFQIVVRNRLNGLRKNGPTSLMALYAAELVVDVYYMLRLKSILSNHSALGYEVSSSLDPLPRIIAVVVIAVIEWIYYSKRRDIFVN